MLQPIIGDHDIHISRIQKHFGCLPTIPADQHRRLGPQGNEQRFITHSTGRRPGLNAQWPGSRRTAITPTDHAYPHPLLL